MRVYEKIKEKLKTRIKSLNRCNWPELSLYFGCCNLSTGIYIRCMFTAVATTINIIFNWILLKSLLDARNTISQADIDVIEEYLEETTGSEQDLHPIYFILDGVVAYYIFWTIFKIFYVIRNVWTIHAVYKKNQRILKILLYIGVPCWIFEGFFSIIGTILLRRAIKVIAFSSFLFEGYNLLAMNSKYKEITGKSRIVRNSQVAQLAEAIYPNAIEPPHQTAVAPNQPHCSTCTCTRINENNFEEIDNEDSVEVTEVAASSTPAKAVHENVNKEDELNFKDSPIIYNQEILEGANSVIDTQKNTTATNINSHNLTRPNTLALKLETEEEKADLCDTPVIYDESQLNVGKSPIVEER